MDQLCNKSEKATTLVFAQTNWWHDIHFITLLKSLKTLHPQMSHLSLMYLPVLLAVYVCLELGWSTTLKASCRPFFWHWWYDFVSKMMPFIRLHWRTNWLNVVTTQDDEEHTCCCVTAQNLCFVFVLLMFKMLRLQSGVWKSFMLMDRHHWHNCGIPSFMTPRAKWEASKIFTFALQVFACSPTSGLHLGPNVWT